MGSNGRMTFGTKHCNLSLLIAEVIRPDIFDWIFDKGVSIFENRLKIGVILFSATFIFLPKGITGLGQNCCRCDAGVMRSDDDSRDTAIIGASAISTAVAGIERGITNVPSTLDENTDKATAPSIPDTSDATSAARPGTYYNNDVKEQIFIRTRILSVDSFSKWSLIESN